MNWKDKTACGPDDLSLFFSNKDESIALAKQICSWCPVMDECLADAMSRREQYGIWGGLTEVERNAYSIRLLLGKPVDSLLNNRPRERKHLANAYSSSPLHISFPQIHTQQVSVTVVVLPSLF